MEVPEEVINLLPFDANFSNGDFDLKFHLALDEDQEFFFQIKLQHQSDPRLQFETIIDRSKVESNSNLRMLQHPYNVFEEMMALKDDLKVTQYG